MCLEIPKDRREIRIALESAEQAIPYAPDREGNYGYVSILKDPTVIDRIPELVGEPIMKEFVKRVHVPNGIFESVRLAHWFQENKEVICKHFMIGFVFRDRGLFSEYRNCIAFAGHLLETIHKDSRIYADAVLLEIQPSIFREEGVQGWMMDLYFAGVGQTEIEASTMLDSIFPFLIDLMTTGQCNL